MIIMPREGWGSDVGLEPAVFEDHSIHRGPHTRIAAWLALGEMLAPDDLTPLALDSLLLDLLSRRWGRQRPARAVATWVARVKQCLEDEYAVGHTLAGLASEAGVSRSLLASEFKLGLRNDRRRVSAVSSPRTGCRGTSVLIPDDLGDRTNSSRFKPP